MLRHAQKSKSGRRKKAGDGRVGLPEVLSAVVVGDFNLNECDGFQKLRPKDLQRQLAEDLIGHINYKLMDYLQFRVLGGCRGTGEVSDYDRHEPINDEQDKDIRYAMAHTPHHILSSSEAKIECVGHVTSRKCQKKIRKFIEKWLSINGPAQKKQGQKKKRGTNQPRAVHQPQREKRVRQCSVRQCSVSQKPLKRLL